MASCDPIESPSGRAWDVRRKRCRERIASQISGRIVARSLLLVAVWLIVSGCVRGGAGLRPFRLDVLQDALDSLVSFHAFVEEELQLGCAPQPQPLAQMAAQERRSPFERTFGVPAGLLVAHRRVVD